MEFEWDEEKARANLAKHGVSFDMTSVVFYGQTAVEDIDDRFDYGEERIVRTGTVKGTLIRVTFTMRGDVIRIISARRATVNEQQDYLIETGTRWPPDAED
jgi:uncharacterized protein